jgi:hypothetical protein
VPSFVQFPHPGREHQPVPPAVGTVMPWNVKEHKRKFLRAHGQFVVDGQHHTGDFAFWGEWEPQSRVVEAWPKDGDKPRLLHEPLYDAPPSGVEHQNTDPLVFGDHFLYTNCKQRIGKLRQLEPGSLVLFGTGRAEGFILDTVFVVGAPSVDYEFGDVGVLPGESLADAVVFGPLASLTADRGTHCRAYRGASWGAPQEELFSYVPARPLGEDVRFARPLVEPLGPLADLINPHLKMGARTLQVSEQRIAEAWAHVRKMVELQGLALGVHAEPPAPAASGIATDPSGASGC